MALWRMRYITFYPNIFILILFIVCHALNANHSEFPIPKTESEKRLYAILQAEFLHEYQ